MLKHEPLGIGHPYRSEPFERTPHYPTNGEIITFRVCADPATSYVNLVLKSDGKKSLYKLANFGPALAHDFGEFGETAKEFVSDSHLADAAARSGEYSHLNEWRVEVETPTSSEGVEYRFESSSASTRVFEFKVHEWFVPVISRLKIEGGAPAGITLSDEEWLSDTVGVVRRVRFTLPLRNEEKVIGFGERFHSVVQNGELVDAVVYEEYKGQGHRTYLPTPFAHVIGGNYGFYIDASTPTFFDVGKSTPNILNIEVEVTPQISNLNIEFFHGNPSDVLRQYLKMVGIPDAPPDWIYDFWISSNEWNTQERVIREVAECLESGIHPGVVVLEAWSDESTFTVFRDALYQPTDGEIGLNAADISYPQDGAWPDPTSMIKYLHERDIKIILWQIPILKDAGLPGSQAAANWNIAIAQNKVVLDAQGDPYKVRGFWFQNGLLPDLTNSDVRDWWAEQRRYLVEDLGVDGFKTDGGEHAWGDDLKYIDGEAGLVKNNQFPVFYAQTFHELLRRYGKVPVTFSRAGFSGSQKFPSFWAGDENSTWKAFRASINAGITASASGFYFWGWDIGGFSGDIPSAELYLRGAAMATFCPIMQIHSEFNHHLIPSNDRTPWNLAKRHKNPNILTIFRCFVEIRRALLPYLTREGAKSIENGRPLMAGLFFDYQDDENIWSVPYQYMLGRDLLIAPVTEEKCSNLRVYLPTGNWIDFFSGENFEGGKFVERNVPLSEIAVFVKDSAWAEFELISKMARESAKQFVD